MTFLGDAGAVGHQGSIINHVVNAVRNGGRIFYFGIPDDPSYAFPLRQFLRKNLSLVAGVTLEGQRFLAEADRYFLKHPGLAESYVTNTLDITETEIVFQRACSPRAGLKVTME